MLPSYSGWIAQLKPADCSQSKMLLQEQGWKDPAVSFQDMGDMKETQVAALCVFFMESLSSVCLLIQTESLVGRTGCHLLYSSKYWLDSNAYQSISSHHRWTGGTYWALDMATVWKFSCERENSAQRGTWISIGFLQKAIVINDSANSLNTNFLFNLIGGECQCFVDLRAHFCPWFQVPRGPDPYNIYVIGYSPGCLLLVPTRGF